MDNQLRQTVFRAMGTTCAVSVSAAPEDEARARRALEAGQAEVAACERVLSRFDPASDLSALNRAEGGWVTVDQRLQSALAAAFDARVATEGRFDPTILPALIAAGYNRSFEQLEEREPATPAGWRAGAEIEIDSVAGRARLQRGATVDLGGIGKGWSAHTALARMRREWPTAPGFMVDLGGDIAVSGAAPQGGPWLIDVANPGRLGPPLARLQLVRGGVATSGRDTRRFGPGGRLHHLIDPATGLSAGSGPLTVTVVAPDAAQAEAHATALAITPPAEAAGYLEARPALAALLVPDVGRPVMLGRLPTVAVERRRVRIKLATSIGGLP
jgi:thiamine biosynthesis lipoprotein